MSVHPGLQGGPIYLDYNATTPVDPLVAESMLPYLTTHFGNPSSAHSYAQTTREAIARAREQVAQLLGCTASEVTFTSCGSESDTLAIRGAALMYQERGKHIITQVTEHPAVLNVCRALERLYGFRVTYLPVDQTGRVSVAEVEEAITEQTVLITIMQANNETGTVQSIAQIAEVARRHGVLMHTDASQAVGKIPADCVELGVDLLTLAGHKLYAPKGIGALYVRRGLRLEPVIYGGRQEVGRRGGTENVPFIVGLGTASILAYEQLTESQSYLHGLRDEFQRQLELVISGVHLNGHITERLPNTLNISIEGVVGEEALAATPQIASSTGSACHEGSTEPSGVLMAMGFARARALGALRLTLGRWSTQEEVEIATRSLVQTVASQRQRRYNRE